MAFTLDTALALGSGQAGIADLRAQIVDTVGGNVGSAVSTGFIEIGQGNYLWHYAAFPDGHRGGVKFYSAAASSTILAFVALNPEEAENVDAKITTRTKPADTQASVASLAAGAISESSFTVPSEASGRPTGILAMIRRIFEWSSNKRTRDRSDGTLLLRNAGDTGTLETQTQSTSGTTDTQTKGV